MRKIPEYEVDGVRLLSVTEILGLAGLNPYDDSGISRDVLEHAADRGKTVHEWAEVMDTDDSVGLPSEGNEIRPYIEAYMKFHDEHNVSYDYVEQSFIHPAFRFAGTIDRAGFIDGVCTVMDLKTTSKLEPIGAIQTAGYSLLLPNKPERRCILQLKKDGRYKLKYYHEPSDESVFLAALTVANYAHDVLGKEAK